MFIHIRKLFEYVKSFSITFSVAFFFIGKFTSLKLSSCQTGKVELWQPMKKFADGPRVLPGQFVAIKSIHKVQCVTFVKSWMSVCEFVY